MSSNVRVILVAWNAGPWLARCIASIRRQGIAESQIWIVDHGTLDDSVETVRRSSPDIHVLVHPANRSYAEAVNLAASRCGGEFLLISNPDTELHDGCVATMVETIQSQPMIAAVGPRLIDERGSNVTRYSRTRFLQTMSVLAAPGVFSGLRNRWTDRRSTVEGPSSVRFIEASIMLVRHSAFDVVGGFDEQFSFYGEDADLCWSFLRSGYELWHDPRATALHAGSATFGTIPDRQRQLFLDGVLLVAWKRSMRRYQWKRRWLAWMLGGIATWEAVKGSRRRPSTLALLKRLQSEAYLPGRPAGVPVPTMAVVIPTLGRPACVERLLNALVGQDDQAFDIVLVIQGPSDPYDAMLAHGGERSNLRIVRLPVSNRATAKNVGARASNADVVLFCDDDIVPPADLIRTHRAAYRDEQCAAVSCRVVEVGMNETEETDRLRLTWYGRIVANASSRRSGPAEVAACGNMSFRRSLLLSFGGFDPLMRGTANLEEFDVSERVRSLGWTIWFDASTTVRHESQPGGNAEANRSDPIGYYRTLHHNLGLIVRRHRPYATLPVVGLMAMARAVRKTVEYRLPAAAVFRIWWGFGEGLKTYRRDQE